MDGLAKISPLVALYAGRDDMLEEAEEAIRVTQDDDITVVVALAYCRCGCLCHRNLLLVETFSLC